MATRKLNVLEKEIAVLKLMELLENIDHNSSKSLSAMIETARKLEAHKNNTVRKTFTSNIAGQNLQELMIAIHSIAFNPSYRMENESDLHHPEKPGMTYPAGKNLQLQGLMNRLAEKLFAYGDKIPPKMQKQLPRIFAEFYDEFMELEPFAFGNSEACVFFLTAVTELADNRDLYLDLRRLTDEQETFFTEKRFVNEQPLRRQMLTSVFTSALSNGISKNQTQVEDIWPQLEDQTIELAHRRFLRVIRDGEVFLVTNNGGLVSLTKTMIAGNGNLEQKINQSVITGTPLNDIKIRPDQISEYIDAEAHSRTSVDGISLANGETLICMDVNPLTALTNRYNKRILDLLEREKMSLFDLAKPEKVEALKATLAKDSDFGPILDIAISNITSIEAFIKTAVDNTFKDKKPVGVGNNSVVITIGGAGSGKGTVGKEKINGVIGGAHYVTASLDDSRELFTLYKILTTLNHHSDDYVLVSQAAAEIRRRIAEKAIKDGYNLLYDGSGIPWSKYSKHAAEWSGKVKDLYIEGAECELYIQKGRRDEFPDTAVERTIDRKLKDNRILPIEETTSRHIAAPDSYLDVFYDSNAPHFALSDRAGPRGNAYTLAQKFSVSDEQLRELNYARKSDDLIGALRRHNLLPPEDKLPKNMRDSNVDFLAQKGQGGQYFILTLTNASRFVDVVRKGTLNKNAQGPEELPIISASGRWAIGITRKRLLEQGNIRDLSRVDYSRN